MNYLLDTHILLWARLLPDKVPPRSRKIINDQLAVKFISPISVWEISLKYALGKLELSNYSPEQFLTSTLELGFQVLPSINEDFASFHRLPAVPGHKDPFDRMLIWQAIQSDMTFLSHDSQLPKYKIHGLKLA